ncbi:hypothetical protein [Sphingobium chungbukense]|uniref:Uncharacterized protein n=1 Tax=Sphingobium chungbukense TaxID=56193 RepID=A0A0M3APZ3_9SPHN|nr:hypothetical protein [Sphingobium chungbukense]KKW92247.1 hypothetical protein YP76_09940 [Sphingobium chungbukense]
MDRVILSGLMKIELRDGRIIRLCDGGFVLWGAEIFRSSDTQFGMIGSMQALEEGVGDEVPAFQLTFLPVSTTAAADLSAPGMQGSRARIWIAEINPDSGLPVGTPDLQFDGMIDRTVLRVGLRKRELDIEFVSYSERLFTIVEGNTLAANFHKSVYPGELGEDNATGLGVGVAWGTEAQPGGNSQTIWTSIAANTAAMRERMDGFLG